MFSYAEVGATTGDLPPGYRVVRRSRHLGEGDGCFRRSADALFDWQLQRRSGIDVPAGTPPVAEGVRARLEVGIGRLRLRAPVEVVYVTEEPDLRGFAYGTLPGHPESGEERFAIRREGDFVVLEITAFSRPATRLARLGGPLTALAQDVMTERYLRALS